MNESFSQLLHSLRFVKDDPSTTAERTATYQWYTENKEFVDSCLAQITLTEATKNQMILRTIGITETGRASYSLPILTASVPPFTRWFFLLVASIKLAPFEASMSFSGNAETDLLIEMVISVCWDETKSFD
jgi:hypothetical protein